ncbi:MAG: OmpH family outer membrane protein [Caulobacteraceae bacterium]|nr:OmpH family outer membrane protein [Caulobacter sp.]
MTRTLYGASAAALALVAASGAMAQARRAAAPAAAPAAAAPAITHGPPLTGICVFSRQGAIGISTAGKAAATRLEQLTAQVRAELQPRETALQSDITAFQKSSASLTADARQKQGAALQQRAQELQTLGRTREAQLEVTRNRALGQIAQRLGPIAQSVYQSRNCSLLLNGDDAVFASNPQMDITAAVVQQLNAQLPTLSFDLSPPQAAAGQ